MSRWNRETLNNFALAYNKKEEGDFNSSQGRRKNRKSDPDNVM